MRKALPRAAAKTALPRSWWWCGLGLLLVAAMLPVIGSQLRTRDVRCSMDGQAIEPQFGVTAVERDGTRHAFCCLACTELWLRRSSVVPRQVLVTDEITGIPLNTQDAYYVRSSVTSNGPTGDRRHVFRNRNAARAHADSFRGRFLTDTDRPFRNLQTPPTGVESGRESSSAQLISK